MNFLKSTAVCCAVCCGLLGAAVAMPQQDSVSIPFAGNLVLTEGASDWTTASAVTMVPGTDKVNYDRGEGVLLHTPGKNQTPAALDVQVPGDVELELEFMASAGSNPVLNVLGKYPITLAGPAAGTVVLDPQEENPIMRVSTPTVNVSKAPGLWQRLKVRYRTGGEEGAGKPSFEAVYLNDVLIHQQLFLASDAAATDNGPLLSFSCPTGAVAFRNVHYRTLEPVKEPTPPADPRAARRFYRVTNPIILNADDEPYLLRSFLVYEGTKKTHTISIGNPDHSNYSYDMKEGALLQVWRGEFMDVTDMWEQRGEPQTATPLGAVVTLTGKPTVAVLATETDRWPDTIAFDDMHSKGYSIGAAGEPTFEYEFAGMQVSDRIATQSEGASLLRTLTVSNPADGAHALLAEGKTIKMLTKDVYVVGDQSYYIQIDRKAGAKIRKTADGEELIVPIGKGDGQVSYSIIW